MRIFLTVFDRYWECNDRLMATLRDGFRELRREFSTGAGRVDLYTIRVYPEGHPNRNQYESDQIQWLFEWSRTITRPRRNKGLIERLIS